MRLIDADELLKILKGMYFHGQLHHHFDDDKVAHNRAIYDASEQIKKAPTIDAVSVVHARWIDETKEFEGFVIHSYRCSACGKNPLYRRDVDYTPTHTEVNFRYDQSNYCPNCGAKMDGGKESDL